MRATKYRRYTKEVKETTSTANKSAKSTVGKSKSKVFSFVAVVIVIAVMMIIPTTTLAPGVEAYEKVNAVSVSEESVIIETTPTDVTDTEPTTQPEKEKEEETTVEETVATESVEETIDSTESVCTYVQEVDKTVCTTEATESTTEEIKEIQASTANDDYANQNGFLISVDKPDKNYSPKLVKLSAYDRNKIERLVMGEAGSLGYTGSALVAQAIRDAMNRSNTTSIDTIISSYRYYAPTCKEPNQTVKDAVSYIFDDNGSAVQHRILCFNNTKGGWHETQKFIVAYGNVRFYDFWK